jgi:formate dehydrogenase major subunit
MPSITINGRKIDVEAGQSILRALRCSGIEVPALCYDDRLKPASACRLCIVTIKGWSNLATACNTPVADGMEIETENGRLERERKAVLKLLANRYPLKAVQEFPDKPFHRHLKRYGLESEALGHPAAELVDASHPYIYVDMSRCIYCYRCVRICEEVQGQFVWQVWNRGAETRIVPDSGTHLRESSCVSCGACVDTCPTGALEDKSILTTGTPANWTKTTCAYCGTGCEMNVGTRNGKIISIRPVMEAPVSKGHLCVKGRYAFEYNEAADRVTAPMIRRGNNWETVSWEEALHFSASELKRILSRYGRQSIGVLGSARATNEENYLAQKFARAVLGTNNVDCCARVCHAPTAAAMKTILGTGAATNSFDDIEQARTILVCGANVTENHPIVGARIKEQVLRGAKLIVIDPRQIELANYATMHLALRPGTNIPLINALGNVIAGEKLYNAEFLRERVSEFDEFSAFISDWTPERAASICGVDAGLIREAARLYALEKPSMCFHGLGVTEHSQGTEGVMALVNLALLTGNIGKPGTGINPLRGQNNVQGSAHMGCEPDNLTGYVSIAENKTLFESVWQAGVPTEKGLNLMQMMDGAAQGRFKALWTIGYDVLLTNANVVSTRRALGAMELVIVQDMFLNETAKEYATVFLPTASAFEKDGSFMNAERRIQRVRKVIEPPGAAKPDWQIICTMAKEMGKGELFDFGSAEEIWHEVRRVWKAGSGISYERIEQSGLQWPCPTEDHPGTRILHSESFPLGKKAKLKLIRYEPTREVVSEEFPFLLITGRTLYQFNAGTMTTRTPNMALHGRDFLDISPKDAEKLGFAEGDKVRLRSAHGEALLAVRLNKAIKPGELFATFHTAEAFVNNVTSPYRDRTVQTPEYKVTAVRIEKVLLGDG